MLQCFSTSLFANFSHLNTARVAKPTECQDRCDGVPLEIQAGYLAGAQESRVPAGIPLAATTAQQNERIGIPSVLEMGCKPCIQHELFNSFLINILIS